MTTAVNIRDAKTHLSRLVEQAARGHEFVIAKAGKHMVCVVPIEAPPTKRRLGTMAGQGTAALDPKKGFEADINLCSALGQNFVRLPEACVGVVALWRVQVRHSRGAVASSPQAAPRQAAHTCLSSCIAGSTRWASTRSTTTWSCGAVAPA